MADTTIRLSLGITGWTVYTRLKTEAGLIWQTTSSTYVAYVVANVANYALAMPETPAASGDYASTMPTGSASGNYTWTHYKRVGGSAAIGDPVVGTGGAYWDGARFATGVDVTEIVTATGDVIAVSECVVDDATPTVNGFVVAMADASAVPTTFVWRGGLACFAEDGPLGGGKFPIASYTLISSTTARITFSPALPVAPADGEAVQVL
jgi:hypothetical protein